jgi:hypothetical protein
MRLIRIAVVCVLAALPSAVFAAPDRSSETIADLLLKGIKAADSGRPISAREKFKQVLKKDPNNYHALVRLGQLETADLSTAEAGEQSLEAERYFLLACVAQPHRPEAYLGLAEMYFNMGYTEEGDHYARIAQDIDPDSYEAFCLLGQRYEDSGNYAGAYDQYNQALQRYVYDAYLVDRRYQAASRGGLDPYRIYPVHVDSNVIWYLLLRRYPDYYLLEKLRRQARNSPESAKHYALPDFGFKYCAMGLPPENQFKDLYEAFLRASVTDEAEYRKLRAELDKIKGAALRAIAGEQGTEAKARALYLWLKKRVLKNYDIKKGILAEQVLNDQKYLCLSGAILYTLIANDAGIPVKGMITPGHAFASLDNGARKIQIELTAEPMFGTTREEGFDVDWWDQFKQLNRVDAYGGLYQGSSNRNIGEIRPEVLTAYQFTNARADGVRKINKRFKEELNHVKSLSTLLSQQNRDTYKKLEMIKGKYRNQPTKLVLEKLKIQDNFRLNDEIEKINHTVMKEQAQYWAGPGMDLLRKARSLAPEVEEFVESQEKTYALKALLDKYPAQHAMEKRQERRNDVFRKLAAQLGKKQLEGHLSGEGSRFVEQLASLIGTLNKELAEIDTEEKEKWNGEKVYWVKALKTLNSGIQELPCSSKLQRSFESLCWQVAKLAQKQEDYDTVEQVVSTAIGTVPDSRFVKEYREFRLGSL